MKRILSVLAAAVVASGLLVAGAYAAKTEAVKGPPPESIKKGMADGPAVVQASGLACTLKNAAWVGAGTETIAKKQVKGDNYEFACAEGPGYLVTKLTTGETQNYTCIQLAAAAAAGHKGPLCTLPENQNLGAQIQPAVDHSGLKCQVA